MEQNQETLEKVVAAETAERRRILGQVYSLILSWRDKRKKGDANTTTSTIQETKSISSDAVAIPHGKYFTIAQVAEICGVNKKTISEWLKKGILIGLNLPGLGQIIEEKELKRYLDKTKIVPGSV